MCAGLLILLFQELIWFQYTVHSLCVLLIVEDHTVLYSCSHHFFNFPNCSLVNSSLIGGYILFHYFHMNVYAEMI